MNRCEGLVMLWLSFVRITVAMISIRRAINCPGGYAWLQDRVSGPNRRPSDNVEYPGITNDDGQAGQGERHDEQEFFGGVSCINRERHVNLIIIKWFVINLHLPFSSLRIEQEPMLGSSPNTPQIPRHVGIKAKKGNSHVQTTIRPRYFRRYILEWGREY